MVKMDPFACTIEKMVVDLKMQIVKTQTDGSMNENQKNTILFFPFGLDTNDRVFSLARQFVQRCHRDLFGLGTSSGMQVLRSDLEMIRIYSQRSYTTRVPTSCWETMMRWNVPYCHL
mmetsp:Transcript_9870/g.17477  ORF Transcript_9870/g.17477 Transcript_9870/m.17477 type:complete len:117 (+) Transcript_9870:1196-1546(+)